MGVASLKYSVLIKALIVSICAIVTGLSLIKQAYAYLDPGTLSVFLQGLVAVIAAALVSASLFWQRIRNILFRKTKKDRENEDQESDWFYLEKKTILRWELKLTNKDIFRNPKDMQVVFE